MLTIAIPYYKGREYLIKAVESVLRQKNPNYFLIISDDQGLDTGIEALIQSFGDARVSYFRNEKNLGMAGNWNRCLELASTDLVCLLHDDDELLPNYTDVMLQAAERYPDNALFFCKAQIIDAHGARCFSLADHVKRYYWPACKEPITLQGAAGLAALLQGNFIMCPTVCYRKSALAGCRFAENWKFVLDFDLLTRLLMRGERFVGLPVTAYSYRRHAGNATSLHTQSLLRFEEECHLFQQLAEIAREKNWRGVERIARRKLIIKLHLLYQMVQDCLHLRPKTFWSKLMFFCKI